MNLDRKDCTERLFEAARAYKPETENIENHFETRFMAKLQERRSDSAYWMSWIWRLVPVFATVAMILIITSFLIEADRSPDIVAAVYNSTETRFIVNDLTGG